MQGVERLGGVCDTTCAVRFAVTDCQCDTYPDNLGPCSCYVKGAGGACAYCDHDSSCHRLVRGVDLEAMAETQRRRYIATKDSKR